MIIKNYSFTNKENPKFIIDTDTNMNWLSHFDSTNYNRIFFIIDKKIDKNYRNLIFDKLKMHGKDIYDIKILAK